MYVLVQNRLAGGMAPSIEVQGETMTEKINKQCNDVVDNSDKYLRTYQDMVLCAKSLVTAATTKKNSKPASANFMDLIMADSNKLITKLGKLIKIVESIAIDKAKVELKAIPKLIEQFTEVNSAWAELEDWADRFELEVKRIEGSKKRRKTKKQPE